MGNKTSHFRDISIPDVDVMKLNRSENNTVEAEWPRVKPFLSALFPVEHKIQKPD